MFKERKSKRAQQAIARRQKKKKRLKTLEQRANSTGTPAEVIAEFSDALKKRNLARDYNRERMRKSRKTIKDELVKGNHIALKKTEKTKKVKQILYSKYKSQDRVRTRKATYRARKRFHMIKTKIESEQIGINSRCVDFSKSKITPLGAAVRYCDVDAVRYILEKKASPTLRCISTRICTPLYDAAWSCKSEVAQLLLENSALPEGGKTLGALHGAIYNGMFKTIRIMLNRGCQVNEYFLDQTPLGAALTCGKSKSGDVRLVRTLLSAKAHIMKETKMCDSPFFKGNMVHHSDLAKKYSNVRCRALIYSKNEQTKTNQFETKI